MSGKLTTVETSPTQYSDAMEALYNATKTHGGCPRAIAFLGLVLDECDPNTLRVNGPKAKNWQGIRGRQPHEVRGFHRIARGIKVGLEVIYPELGRQHSIQNLTGWLSQAATFKVQAGTRRLEASLTDEREFGEGPEHVVRLSEKSASEDGDQNTDVEIYLQSLRARLYGEELTTIAAETAGDSGLALLETFDEHCPGASVFYSEVPDTEEREVEVGLFQMGYVDFWKRGSSRMTSFNLHGDVTLEDGAQILLYLHSDNYRKRDAISHIQGVVLDAEYRDPGYIMFSEPLIRTSMSISSRAYRSDTDKRGYAGLQRIFYGCNNQETGEFVGSPIPQGVDNFLSELARKVEQRRMDRFAQRRGQVVETPLQANAEVPI